MLNIFKNYDLVEEMEKHLSEDEDIFAECRPNKLPFIMKRIWQPLIVTAVFVAVVIGYVLFRPFIHFIFQNVIDIALIFAAIAVIGFIGYEICQAIIDTKTNYYVIATDGIHILYFDKTLQYECILYKDIKSVILKSGAFGVGDIYIKENSEKLPSGLIEKFMYQRSGLIGIDEADKVFEVIRQIAIQDNDNIFFADSDSESVDTSYFKDVKKYDHEIKQKRDESIISRRNNSK